MRDAALLVLLIICTFIFSCGKKTTEPDPVVPAKLCGRVTHAVYGYPLNQTSIGTTPYLDNGGPYGLGTFTEGKFCLFDMEPGPWEIRFYKLGYQTDTLQVTLAEGESLYVEMSLQRKIPDSGSGFYYAGFPFSETGNLDESSLVICTDYPDSLVISSQHGE